MTSVSEYKGGDSGAQPPLLSSLSGKASELKERAAIALERAQEKISPQMRERGREAVAWTKAHRTGLIIGAAAIGAGLLLLSNRKVRAFSADTARKGLRRLRG